MRGLKVLEQLMDEHEHVHFQVMGKDHYVSSGGHFTVCIKSEETDEVLKRGNHIVTSNALCELFL